eukprot:TRINITY_DN254_c0_g3_i6.p1 TRINITY_DN254_c0_g3~~TRINITY_DN254_c0_g3_i6.p1  ORF type:complete len:202 (+),score=6.83 TRINITY_DN254_c0_g3_i6:701-1306(+)
MASKANYKQQHVFCEVCEQPSRLCCSRCRLVAYCGSEHQRQHYNVHRRKCQTKSEEPSSGTVHGFVTNQPLDVSVAVAERGVQMNICLVITTQQQQREEKVAFCVRFIAESKLYFKNSVFKRYGFTIVSGDTLKLALQQCGGSPEQVCWIVISPHATQHSRQRKDVMAKFGLKRLPPAEQKGYIVVRVGNLLRAMGRLATE